MIVASLAFKDVLASSAVDIQAAVALTKVYVLGGKICACSGCFDALVSAEKVIDEVFNVALGDVLIKIAE